MLQASGKKPGTIITEKTHYKRWQKALGHLRLDKIRPSHIQDALNKLRAVRSPRTCNVALVCLRHVLKAAKRDGYLKTLPTEDIAWQRTEQKSRRLFTREDVDVFCQAALSIAPVVPLMVACAAVNVAVPKSARGKTPELDDGASTIHSAEDRSAVAFWVVVNDLPVVLSLICRV